jgi:hypothetical protein
MTDQIEARIGAWLDSRKPPSGLTDEQRAAQRSDIIAIVRRAAPAEADLGEWLGRVLEGAILRQKSASWPPPEVWGNVVGSLGGKRQPAPDHPTSRGEMSFRLFVKRINAGEAVSEHDLFSEKVCGRALRDRAVSLDTVLDYVRAAYQSRCHVYSPEKAMAWLEGRNPKLAAKIAAEQQAQADLRDVTGAEG